MMFNIILITTPNNPNYSSYIPCEEQILRGLSEANKDKIALKVIRSEPNSESSLFKKFPLIYIDNKIIDNHSLLFFIRELIYHGVELEENELIHFSYLLSFLRSDFRQIYTREYSSLQKKTNDSLNSTIGFPLSRIQAFYNFFLLTKEKDFICLIIKYFFEEYQSVIPLEDIDFSVDNNSINMNILKLSELNEADTLAIINKYSMNLNSSKGNSQDEGLLQEMEVSKSWKNSLFSLGLFAGVSAILLVLSMRKQK